VPQYRDLHYYGHFDLLHPGSDPAEDMGVCDRLQRSEFLRIIEDDGGETTAIDLFAFDGVGPPSRHLRERRAIGLQHLMSDGVSVDRMDTMGLEKTPHLALARSQAAAEDPSTLLRTHKAGR
jgi:hypothetical protein